MKKTILLGLLCAVIGMSQSVEAFRFGPRLGIYNEVWDDGACFRSRETGLQFALNFEQSPRRECHRGNCGGHQGGFPPYGGYPMMPMGGYPMMPQMMPPMMPMGGGYGSMSMGGYGPQPERMMEYGPVSQRPKGNAIEAPARAPAALPPAPAPAIAAAPTPVMSCPKCEAAKPAGKDVVLVVMPPQQQQAAPVQQVQQLPMMQQPMVSVLPMQSAPMTSQQMNWKSYEPMVSYPPTEIDSLNTAYDEPVRGLW